MVVIDAIKNIFTTTKSGYAPIADGPDTFLRSDATFTNLPTSGTVTNISITPNDGLSASVSNSTVAPVLNIGMTNITPQSVSAQTISASGQSVLQGINILGMQQLLKGTDVTTTATMILPNDGNFYNLVGGNNTSRIETSAGYQNGYVVTFRVAAGMQFNHNLANVGTQHSYRLPSSTNFVATAGDMISFVYDASTPCWRTIMRTLA